MKIDINQLKDMIIDETPFWDRITKWWSNDGTQYRMYWDSEYRKLGVRDLIIEDLDGNKTKYEVTVSIKKKGRK